MKLVFGQTGVLPDSLTKLHAGRATNQFAITSELTVAVDVLIVADAQIKFRKRTQSRFAIFVLRC